MQMVDQTVLYSMLAEKHLTSKPYRKWYMTFLTRKWKFIFILDEYNHIQEGPYIFMSECEWDVHYMHLFMKDVIMMELMSKYEKY